MNLEFLKEKADWNFHCLFQSVSPGGVLTEIVPNMEAFSEAGHPFLNAEDISNAVLYVLSTPPHVQVKKYFQEQ